MEKVRRCQQDDLEGPAPLEEGEKDDILDSSNVPLRVSANFSSSGSGFARGSQGSLKRITGAFPFFF